MWTMELLDYADLGRLWANVVQQAGLVVRFCSDLLIVLVKCPFFSFESLEKLNN